MKFKVGDRVLVTKKRSGASRVFNGMVCVISKVHNAEICNLKEEETCLENVGGVWTDELTLRNKINTPKDII